MATSMQHWMIYWITADEQGSDSALHLFRSRFGLGLRRRELAHFQQICQRREIDLERVHGVSAQESSMAYREIQMEQ